MSFIPNDLDQQAAALPGAPSKPTVSSAPAGLMTQQMPALSTKASTDTGLMAQNLPAQTLAPRAFSDPSYLMEINEIRAKVNAGTATKDDLKRAIALIRETRGAVSTPASKPKRASSSSAKPKTAKPDGQALLDLL